MALSLANFKPGVSGNRRSNIVDVTFDSSYPTGGEALTPAQLGLISVDTVLADGKLGYTFPYDRTNQKLLAFNGTTQAANEADLSAVTTRVVAIGY